MEKGFETMLCAFVLRDGYTGKISDFISEVLQEAYKASKVSNQPFFDYVEVRGDGALVYVVNVGVKNKEVEAKFPIPFDSWEPKDKKDISRDVLRRVGKAFNTLPSFRKNFKKVA